MVQALSTKRALGSWEIMNEPEGSVLIAPDPNPCFSTTILTGTGAGWTGEGIPMFRFLRFINRQAAAIKRTDTKALVSTGSWSELSRTDAFPNTRKPIFYHQKFRKVSIFNVDVIFRQLLQRHLLNSSRWRSIGNT